MNNKKIGFIAGVFDAPEGRCPHDGHLHILKTARSMCDYFVVACNSDKYIREKKNREPLLRQSKRIEALYNTQLVDEIIPFESDPLPIIMMLKPTRIFVGSDYKIENVRGWPECKEWGGNICIIDRINNISTTNIIKKLEMKENEELMSVFQGKIALGQKL
jgi:rfaE bifunctional protein nucleotidyltransferase chain/domain